MLARKRIIAPPNFGGRRRRRIRLSPGGFVPPGAPFRYYSYGQGMGGPVTGCTPGWELIAEDGLNGIDFSLNDGFQDFAFDVAKVGNNIYAGFGTLAQTGVQYHGSAAFYKRPTSGGDWTKITTGFPVSNNYRLIPCLLPYADGQSILVGTGGEGNSTNLNWGRIWLYDTIGDAWTQIRDTINTATDHGMMYPTSFQYIGSRLFASKHGMDQGGRGGIIEYTGTIDDWDEVAYQLFRAKVADFATDGSNFYIAWGKDTSDAILDQGEVDVATVSPPLWDMTDISPWSPAVNYNMTESCVLDTDGNIYALVNAAGTNVHSVWKNSTQIGGDGIAGSWTGGHPGATRTGKLLIWRGYLWAAVQDANEGGVWRRKLDLSEDWEQIGGGAAVNGSWDVSVVPHIYSIRVIGLQLYAMLGGGNSSGLGQIWSFC